MMIALGIQKARGRGFTLVELVIVIIVIGIMAAALAPLALSSLQAYDAVHSNIVVLDKLRYATERLAREIREVNYDSDTKTFAFTSRGTNSMVFTRTYETSSGETPPNVVTIGTSNVLASCTIKPCVTLTYSLPTGVGEQVLTDELGSLTFSYYKDDGITLAAGDDDVRYVEIDLRLSHTINGVVTTYPQRTRIELKRFSRS